MIDVSVDGLFAPVLEDGLQRSAWTAIQADIERAHRHLMQQRGKDVGFYDVHLQQSYLFLALSYYQSNPR